MNNPIINILDLSDSRSRSVSLERDIYHGDTVEGYLPTSNSLSALKRIATTLETRGSQRAWRLVGPYGSGKSAFGLWIAQVLFGRSKFPKASEILFKQNDELANNLQASNRFALAVVGSRCSFGYALANAILKAIEHHTFASKFINDIDLVNKTYKSSPLNSVCSQILSDFLEIVIKNGYSGLTLIIDEVGKFVEYAALHPQEADLIAIQQVSEIACKKDDDRIIVIALLHQHFANYAAGVGRILNDEWQKVSSRLEEIPFDEPIDQYVNFASHALNSSLDATKHKSIIDQSQALFESAINLGLFQLPNVNRQNLKSLAPSLYPLHPAALYAGAIASKRFGQSERSFHAFIFGNEDFGLKKFSSVYQVGSWYNLANLYDYFTVGISLKFRELSAERKWSHARHIISASGLDEASSSILKAIAILEVTNTPKISAELISFCVDQDIAKTIVTLREMINKGLLLQRRDFQEYSIATSDSVNIEALYETAAKSDTNNLLLEGINQLLSTHKVVANKHYINTGTFRTLGIIAGTQADWPTTNSTQETSDAWLKIVLVDEDDKVLNTVTQRIKKEVSNPLEVSLIIQTNPETKAALMEYSIWKRVLFQLSQTQLDPWSTRYVEGRTNDAAKIVEELIINTLTADVQKKNFTFWHKGKAIEQIPEFNLSKLASWLFDKTYPDSPKIVNELINKNKLSPAIVQARQRLVDLFLKGSVQGRLFGDEEFPPERLIYFTLLEQTKLCSQGQNEWRLHNPLKGENKNFLKVWEAITSILQSQREHTFASVLDELARPPFGLRSGPASVWLATYLLINKANCAIFERGSLVLELTSEHFQRLFKNPSIFKIRELKSSSSKELMDDYRHALSTVGSTLESTPSYLELARTLILWFAKLPEYAKKTQRVSADTRVIREIIIRAQDPIELLTITIPSIYTESKSDRDFRSWLTECLSSLGMALRNLQNEVTDLMSTGFKIPGSLLQIRNQLQSECINQASTISEARLKAFVNRCMDVVLTDEKWLDAIASLIVLKPLDSWHDDTLQSFENGLYELCRQYNHWMYVVLQKGKASPSANRFMAVTLTQAGGEEKSVLVTMDQTSKALATEILSVIHKSTVHDPKVLVAAITQALMEVNVDQEELNAKGQNIG